MGEPILKMQVPRLVNLDYFSFLKSRNLALHEAQLRANQ